MNQTTRQNALWLDMRYRIGQHENAYYAHAPIFGFDALEGTEAATSTARRYALGLQLQRRIGRLAPKSLLDVGCAEGFLLANARELWGIDRVFGCDISAEVCRVARAGLGVPSAPACAHALPFEDASWDVVVMSEVLEHLDFPLQALAECWRVARRAVIVTTQEFCFGELRRRVAMADVNRCRPHAERQWTAPSDLKLVFGAENLVIEPQGSLPASLRVRLHPGDEAVNIAKIKRVADDRDASRAPFGAIAVAVKDPRAWHAVRRAAPRTDEEIVRSLFRARSERAIPEGPAPLQDSPAFLRPPCGTPLMQGDGDTDDELRLGAPDFRMVLDTDDAVGILESHIDRADLNGAHGRRLLKRDLWLRKPRRWGGLSSLAGAVAETCANHWEEQRSLCGRVRRIVREGYRAAREVAASRHAVRVSPAKLEALPATAVLGADLDWWVDVSNVPGAFFCALEVSHPDEPLPPHGRLLEGTSRLILQPPLARQPFPSHEFFPAPGVYRLQAFAVSERGLLLGEPSPELTLTLTPMEAEGATPP